MRMRILGAIAAVLLAAVGTLVLVLYVRTAEQRALAGERTVEVLVVREQIEKGTAGSSIADLVATEQVPAKVQALGSVSSLEDLDGKVASVDLLPGEQIVSSRFVDPEQLRPQAQVDIPDGLLQVTVSLDPARAVGGQLEPGATAAVLGSFDPFNIDGSTPEEGAEEEPTGERKTPNTTHIILHKTLVTNVQVEQLPVRPEEGQEEASEPLPDLAPTGNLLVTLAVDAPSAERIVFTAEHGFLWLAIEPENAPEDGTKIQTRGTIYE